MRQRPPRHAKKPPLPHMPHVLLAEHDHAVAHDAAKRESAREHLKALQREIMRDDLIAQRESNLAPRV